MRNRRNAERQRRFRRRRRLGRVPVVVDLSEYFLIEQVELGRLAQTDLTDKDAIAVKLGHLVESFLAEKKVTLLLCFMTARSAKFVSGGRECSTLAKKTSVARPEDDPDFARLAAERDSVHRQLDAAFEVIERGRGRLDELMAASAAGGGSAELRAEQRAIWECVRDAEGQRDRSRARLREFADLLPVERARAAQRIAKSVAPKFNQHARDFLVARLARLSPEIVASHYLRRIRDEIEARRVGFHGMASPSSAVRFDDEAARLREDVLDALEKNVLKIKDVPREVVEIWSLK